MNGSDTMFLIAGLYGLAASCLGYLFAKNIVRRRMRRSMAQEIDRFGAPNSGPRSGKR